MFIAALFTIVKICKQPRCSSTNKWIKKMWYTYILSHKKNVTLPFATTWMDVDSIMLSEMS